MQVFVDIDIYSFLIYLYVLFPFRFLYTNDVKTIIHPLVLHVAGNHAHAEIGVL